MKSLFIFLNTLFISTLSHASHNSYYYPSSCVEEYVTPVGDISSDLSPCEKSEDLRLAWTTLNYPNMSHNPRRVQYWQGSYTIKETLFQRYKVRLINTCYGEVLSEDTYVSAFDHEHVFEITNPNLDPDISESYMLVPLTKAEAQQELEEAQARCLSYRQ